MCIKSFAILWISRVDFPKGQRSDDDEDQKEPPEKRPRKPAPYRAALCGRHIGKGGPSDEETSGVCHNETS